MSDGMEGRGQALLRPSSLTRRAIGVAERKLHGASPPVRAENGCRFIARPAAGRSRSPGVDDRAPRIAEKAPRTGQERPEGGNNHDVPEPACCDRIDGAVDIGRRRANPRLLEISEPEGAMASDRRSWSF